jgi:hypothetical protein
MTRFFWLLIILLSFMLSLQAKAHTISFNELNGVTLCIETRSVQVSIHKPDQTSDQEYLELTTKHLQESLPATLKLFNIPFQEKASCQNDPGFIYVLYYTNWGKDTNAVPYFVYAASVQVGGMPSEVTPDFELALPDLKFENYYSALLFEDELPKPLHENMVLTNDEMIEELAIAWLENYELGKLKRQTQQKIYLRWGLGASILLTSIIIAFGVWLSQRKKGQARQDELLIGEKT